MVVEQTTQDVPPKNLRFDPRNPRLPTEESPAELDSITALVESADVDELVQSITHAGWLNYEPLIALSPTHPTEPNVVLEGNRRLAALRIIAEPDLQRQFGIRLPTPANEHTSPSTVRVWYVDSRAEARDFIGFKHVNGPFKWDSFAKAKYAYEWISEEGVDDVDDIAKRLGDNHNTVLRLVNGYTTLMQGVSLGFDMNARTKTAFAFSHLYTALPRPSVRQYLAIDVAPTQLLPANPVPESHHEKLQQLLTWLYGQNDQPSVIKSQNPNLNQLVDVLENKTATAILAAQGELSAAYSQVEDRTQRFTEQLFALQSAAKAVAGSVGDFEFDPDLMDIAISVQRTVNRVIASMRSADSSEDLANSSAR